MINYAQSQQVLYHIASIISYNTEFLVNGSYVDLLEDHLGGWHRPKM